MLLTNPNTGKPVDVAEAFVDRFLAAGFKKQEPEAVATEVAAPVDAPKRRGRPRRS